LKPFEETDGTVIGYTQMLVGDASLPREEDEFGQVKSLTRVGDTYLVDLLGALIVQLESGTTVKVGSGFDMKGGEKDRGRLWKERESLVGRRLTFRYLMASDYDKPRCPTFKRWRES
jgi:hypothetical protein